MMGIVANPPRGFIVDEKGDEVMATSKEMPIDVNPWTSAYQAIDD
jgi:hypothetical protein